LLYRLNDDFIDTMAKSKRTNKIYIDYLRNQRGSTSIAAYSTRAKENAPVSTPIAWNELSMRIKSNSFTVKNLPKRLDRLKKDPWKDFFKIKQSLIVKNKK
jgi:bifunctional non-homologous end joining protein LigD